MSKLDISEVQTKEDAVKMAFRISAIVHRPINVNTFDLRKHYAIEKLKPVLRELLTTWGIKDPYYDFLHFDVKVTEMTRKEYQKQYQRDYRRFGLRNRISMVNWGMIPKKRGRKPQQHKDNKLNNNAPNHNQYAKPKK